MTPIKDISGHRFGRLVVSSYAGKGASRHALWNAECDCGSEGVYSGKQLRSGHTQSCGCKQRESVIKRNTKHGMAKVGNKHPDYAIWQGMKRRCLDPSEPHYKNYGARGITICDEWVNDFAQFVSDMGPRLDKKLTLERSDNNQGYSPYNCVWATRTQQGRNRRGNRAVVRGDGLAFKTIAEAVEAVGGNSGDITAACKGRLKTSGGHTWKYLEESI